jgi:2-polyprenyl-3-methyl-5-hydroxy-6-metoxy-1,4-benzoquinol methylase
MQVRDRTVETLVREVYSYCPPTKTHYTTNGRRHYETVWRTFMESLGVSPSMFRGRRVLDVGCGSCEKASFYADWGAAVTGLEMTAPVLTLARDVIGDRDVTLVHASMFDYTPAEPFDIVIADGVLHHCEDTFEALKRCASFVAPGGLMIIGLVNVWGRFWWFKPARGICRVLAPRDFHRRALWGRRLFGWTRRTQEGTNQDAFHRTEQSWAYDWFANPRWNTHRPATVIGWLSQLGFDHVGSVPPLAVKDAPSTWLARVVRAAAGPGAAWMALYWLATKRQNMFYFVAARSPQPQQTR